MRSPRIGQITVESDWITTLEVGALFVVCGLLLAGEIHNVLYGQIAGEHPVHRDFLSILIKVFTPIAAAYCFMLAFRFPKTSVRTAFLLVGADLVRSAVLSVFHVPSVARHAAVIAGSAARQIALAIFLVAIAQWFKSVVHWAPPSEPQGGDPD
ncbi:membrane hypothetical protein [Candidatus Sulfotelmatobacter kueseliae]|uniref:Uncharacterized protein n=1 Tax=Candidatus Sulfotelmatobacter kueseliae TaxID=2042962 RepID=A0A2U3K275_9BACT|nr:membrane hypothetical protein [Candidatus Sulfotelmatobacter kueseliae]